MTENKRSMMKRGAQLMTDVPVFCVVDGRCFASARDKAMLDRYLTSRRLPLLPVEVICAASADSPLSLDRIGVVA